MNEKKKAEKLLEYLRGKNHFPLMDRIARDNKLTKQELTKMLNYLETTGEVSRSGRHRKLNHKTTKEKVISAMTNQTLIIRVIMGFVGIGALFCSIYFTGEYFRETFHVFWSYLFSVIMVLFSVGSIETVILLWKQNILKRYKVILCSTILILWLIVIVFSMTTTVIGQFNKREALTTKQNKVDPVEIELNNLNSDKRTIEIDIKLQRKQLNVVIGQYEKKEDTYSQRKLNEQITEIKKEMRKLTTYLENQNSIINKFVKENDIRPQKRNFYIWLSSFTNANPDMLQFVISIFAAVFFDVISAMGVSLALFLKE